MRRPFTPQEIQAIAKNEAPLALFALVGKDPTFLSFGQADIRYDFNLEVEHHEGPNMKITTTVGVGDYLYKDTAIFRNDDRAHAYAEIRAFCKNAAVRLLTEIIFYGYGKNIVPAGDTPVE